MRLAIAPERVQFYSGVWAYSVRYRTSDIMKLRYLQTVSVFHTESGLLYVANFAGDELGCPFPQARKLLIPDPRFFKG